MKRRKKRVYKKRSKDMVKEKIVKKEVDDSKEIKNVDEPIQDNTINKTGNVKFTEE